MPEKVQEAVAQNARVLQRQQKEAVWKKKGVKFKPVKAGAAKAKAKPRSSKKSSKSYKGGDKKRKPAAK